jgi:hypothetical protein
VTDWPLAVCDARTVNLERDCIALDVVSRDFYTENYQLYPNDNYKWYYLNNQKADEVMIFRQTDTDDRYTVGMFSSFSITLYYGQTP